MGVCWYCGDSTADGVWIGHAACRDQFGRRLGAGICVWCGRERAHAGISCDGCRYADRPRRVQHG